MQKNPVTTETFKNLRINSFPDSLLSIMDADTPLPDPAEGTVY